MIMNRGEITEQVLKGFVKVAPEMEGERIDCKVNLQDQYDLDSVDLMNFVLNLQEDFHIEIANEDFRKFSSIGGAVDYLMTKL